MSTVPLKLLVGLTRLLAIYYGLKCIDSTGVAVAAYSAQISVLPELAEQFPYAWVIYIGTLIFYLLLVVLTWFLAPAVCRLALRSGVAAPPEEHSSIEVNWGEIMIFLTGILLLGWGIDQLAGGLLPLIQSRSQDLNHELSLADQMGFFVAFAKAGLGALLALRFPSVYAWCQKRKGLSGK